MAKMQLSCPTVLALDRQKAKSTGASVHALAALRHYYEQTTGDLVESLEDYDKKLLPFKNSLTKKHIDAINNSFLAGNSMTFTNALEFLGEAFSNEEINWVTESAFGIIESFIDGCINLSRQGKNEVNALTSAIEAFKQKYGFEPSRAEIFSIIENLSEKNSSSNSTFNFLYNLVVNRIATQLINKKKLIEQNLDISFTDRDKALLKAIRRKSSLIEGESGPEDYASCIVWLIKNKLRKAEGIDLGTKAEFKISFDTSEDSLGGAIDIEESPKEHWMIKDEKTDPFKSVTQRVRSVLYRIPKFTVDENGKTIQETDSIGIPLYESNVTMHKTLLGLFKHCLNQNQFEVKLKRAAVHNKQLAYILDLCKDPQFLQELVASYRKTNIRYRGVKVSQTFGEIGRAVSTFFHGPFLNHYTHNSFNYRIQYLRNDFTSSIFRKEEDGKVVLDAEKFAEFQEYMTNSVEFDPETFTSKMIQQGVELSNVLTAKSLLQNINKYLNLNIKERELDYIVNNIPQFKRIISNAYLISRYAYDGTDGAAANDFTTFWQSNNQGKTKVYEKTVNIKKSFDHLFSAIKESVQSYSSSKIRVGDSDYMTDVTCNKFANIIDTFRYAKSIVSEILAQDEYNEAEVESVLADMRKYLRDNYLSSSEYARVKNIKENGEPEYDIFNGWLNLLYNTNTATHNLAGVSDSKNYDNSVFNPESLFNKIEVIRTLTLGNDNEINAEDFTTVQNLTSMIANYFAINKQDSNTGLSDYTLFTTGDSGAVKTITAPRYSGETLVQQFYQVAWQEIRRAIMQRKIKAAYTKNGTVNMDINGITRMSSNVGLSGFALLPMFNTQKIVFDGKAMTPLEAINLITVWKAKAVAKTTDLETKKLYASKYDTMLTKFIQAALRGGDLVNKEIIPFKGTNLEGNEFTVDFLGQGGVLNSYFKNEFWYKVKDFDIFKYNEGAAYFPEFFTEEKGYYKGIKISTEMPNSIYANNDLRNFFLNSTLANAYIFQLNHFTPDLFPSATQHQKREKATNTPGVFANINATDFNGKLYSKDGIERVQYFKELKVSLENEDRALWKALNKIFPTNTSDASLNAKNASILKIYTKIASTDGQGFRTLASYRKVMGMTKKWTHQMEIAYNELNKIRAIARAENRMLTTEELDKIDSLNMVFQPIKPHLAGAERIYLDPEQMKLPLKERTGDYMYIGVEHKYAEVIIIPEMFPVGSLRRTLGEYMENPEGLVDFDPADGIDLMCSEECVKAGKWGAIDIRSKVNDNMFYIDSEGNQVSKESEAATASLLGRNGIYDSDVVKQLRAGITHQFNYEDYTIQNETPEHIKAAQLFGTQIRKHVMDALLSEGGGAYNIAETLSKKGIKEFYFAGRHYHLDTPEGRKGLMILYNSLICTAINNSLQDTISSVKDASTLAPILSALKANDINSIFEDHLKFGLTTDENGVTTFKYPLAEGFGLYDIEASLTSIFKNNVNKQKINGGSAVQMSDAGLFADGYKLKCHVDSNGNVTHSECAMAWNLSYTDSNGKEIDLKYSDYCLSTGELRSTVDPTRAVADGEDSKLEQEFPGILDLVAYRIPTERDYSILNLKVVRFLPKIAGGVMAVPSAFIAAAGFDFDIDKLYYFRKEYKEKRRKEKVSKDSKLWNKIYNIEVTETEEGTKINEDNATDIYFKLKAERDAVEKEINRANKFISTARKNKSLSNKNIKELALAEGIDLDNLPTKKEYLFQYWEDAGLNKSIEEGGTGMSASEYFAKVATEEFTNNPLERFIGYDSEIDPREQSSTAINNMIIEIIQSRLSDPNTMPIRFTPGGFVNAKIASRVIKGLIRPENPYSLEEMLTEAKEKGLDMADYDISFDAVNPLTTCIFNERNSIAGKTIGIFANHSTNMVYCQSLNYMQLKDGKEVIMVVDGKEVKFKDLIHNEDGKLYIAELLAASVDAVKDPVLNFLNINTYTANTAAFMARLGISPLQIGLFLNQPIIKNAITYMSNNNMRDLSKGIRRFYRETYRKELDTTVPITNYDFTSIENLAKGIQGGINQAENVLKYFFQLAQEGQALSDFIGKTKYTAANTVENSVGGMMATVVSNKLSNSKESLLAETIDFAFSLGDQNLDIEAKKQSSPIVFNSKVSASYMQSDEYWQFLANHPMAFEQLMHDSMLSFTKALSYLFGYYTPTYSAIYNTLFQHSFKSNISKGLMDKVNYSYPAYKMQHLKGYNFSSNYFNGEEANTRDADHKRRNNIDKTPLTNREYYSTTFPVAMAEILNRRTDIISLLELSKLPKNSLGLTSKEVLAQAKESYRKLQSDYGYLQDISFEEFTTNKMLDALKGIIEYTDEEDSDIPKDATQEEIDEARLKNSKTKIGFSDNAHFDTETKIDFSSAWESLFGRENLEKDDIQDPNESLAGMLVMYNFFNGGFNAGSFNFGNLVPRRVLAHLAVGQLENAKVSYMKAFQSEIVNNYNPAIAEDINEFLLLLYANNSDDYTLVKNVPKREMSVGNGLIKSNVYPEGRMTTDAKGYSTITFMNVFSKGDNANATELLLPRDKGDNGLANLIPAFKYNNKLFVLASKDARGVKLRENNILMEHQDVVYREIPIRDGNDYSPLDMDTYYHFNATSESKRFMTEVYFSQESLKHTDEGAILRSKLNDDIKRICEENGLCKPL